MERFRGEVSFDAFSFSQSGPHRQYQGSHSGRLVGTLKKILSGTSGAGFDLWMTTHNPVSGHFSMNDTHVHNPPDGAVYTASFNASGSPYDGPDVASYIMLKLNHESCTFDLITMFVIQGEGTQNGVVNPNAMDGSGITLFNMPLSSGSFSDPRTLQGSLAIDVVADSDQTGYVPPDSYVFTSRQGGTTVHWTLTPIDEE